MNSDISTMITLQAFWDKVIQGRQEIERSKKSIAHWKNHVREINESRAVLENEIKTSKSTLKKEEIDLSEKDEKARQLEKRKTTVKTERELSALESEQKKLDEDRSLLEEEILVLLDSLEDKSSDLEKLTADCNEASAQAESDISMLLEKIEGLESLVRENTDRFNEVLAKLSPQVKSRFKKLVESEHGKAIVGVEGETCGGCHFQIPLHLIVDASKDDKVVNCTNCGRFIYKD